jgi:hypothetical protein
MEEGRVGRVGWGPCLMLHVFLMHQHEIITHGITVENMALRANLATGKAERKTVTPEFRNSGFCMLFKICHQM